MVIAAIREGWKQVWLHRKAWVLWYLGNLLLAGVAVLPFRSFLKSGAGHSTELAPAAGAFDFTLFADLLRNHGDGLPALITTAVTMVGVYLLLSCFLSGGVLHLYTTPENGYATGRFVQGSARYFWRLAGIAVMFVCCYVILLLIAFLLITGGAFNPMMIENDVAYVRNAQVIGSVFLLIAVVVMMIHTFAKIIVVETSKGVFFAIRTSIAFVFRNFGRVVLLYVVNGLILLSVVLLYKFTRELIPVTSAIAVLLLFIFGQLFLFARIGVKLLVMASGQRLRRGVFMSE